MITIILGVSVVLWSFSKNFSFKEHTIVYIDLKKPAVQQNVHLFNYAFTHQRRKQVLAL